VGQRIPAIDRKTRATTELIVGIVLRVGLSSSRQRFERAKRLCAGFRNVPDLGRAGASAQPTCHLRKPTRCVTGCGESTAPRSSCGSKRCCCRICTTCCHKAYSARRCIICTRNGRNSFASSTTVAIRFDNNACENAIRPFVVGRKNWLFSDSVAGAQASANLYSLIESAKANGIELYRYLRYVQQLPAATTVDDYEALLPWNIKPGTLPVVIPSRSRSELRRKDVVD
jgi:hypothetical protein